MTKTIIKSASLFYRDAGSDKEYNLFLEKVDGGYNVVFTYGRRGNANQSGTKNSSPISLEEAEKVYTKLYREKTAKGYTESGVAKPFTSTPKEDRVTGLAPMLLNPIKESELDKYIQSSEWVMQEKLDGKRLQIIVKNHKVTASNRLGLSVGIPEEIAKELGMLNDCVIDGELIGTRFVAFDIIKSDQADVTTIGAKDRMDILLGTFVGFNFKNINVLDTAVTEADKQLMYDRVKKCKGEGVVLKLRDSKYVPGRPNSGGSQLKCKFWESATCKVVGIHPSKRSISVGVLQGKSLVEMGNVKVPTNYLMPQIGDCTEIKYLYAFPDGGKLCQPQYLGIRDDKKSADQYDTLKFKVDVETDSDED